MLKHMHPVYKFIAVFAPAILLALFYHPLLNLLVFGICIVCLLWQRVALKELAVFLIPAAVIAAGMFATGYYYPSNTYLGVASLTFSSSAVLNGLQLSSRVLAFVGLGMLFVLTTSPTHFVIALHQMGVPAKFCYGILAAWGMLPRMRMEYKQTRAAFRARGMNPFLLSPSLLIPLLVKSVRWSEALAIAMESKGFDGEGPRTQYKKIQAGHIDLLVPIVSSVGTILGLILL